MITNVLRLLSTDKYLRLIPRLFGNAAALQLCDDKMNILWRDREFDCDDPSSSFSGPWESVSEHISRRANASGNEQYRTALESREFGIIGWLFVSFDRTHPEGANILPQHACAMIHDALPVLLDDIELQLECNQLAVELTERYEELNLVYQTNDQVTYFEEGHEALVLLTQNCAESLDVAVAALICRDMKLCLSSDTDPESENREPMHSLKTSIYDFVESQIEPLVINSTDTRLKEQLLANIDQNIVVVPVVDDHGSAIGILAAASYPGGRSFSNGDRNLLDVMAKKAARIIHTHHDSLTSLLNRNGLESALFAAHASTRSGTLTHCLIHIDLDQLHVVNDLVGHHAGDLLLQRVAKVLRSNVTDNDTLARLGSDEFAVIVRNCDLNRGADIGLQLRDAVNELTVVTNDQQLAVSISVGVASIDARQSGIVAVLANAEIACEAAKEEGRNRVTVYSKDNSRLKQRSGEVEWMSRVQKAIREDHFRLVFQPVVPLNPDNYEPHFEVLVRLQDGDELLAPAVFLPAAERYQLMPLVDRWVVRSTLHLLGTTNWSVLGDNAVFCINLSGQSLTSPGFASFIEDELAKSAVSAATICFEITETAAISNIHDALDFMASVRALGCKFSLDDFGAGLSSFGYLKKLPVDYLKIDGSLVSDVCDNEVSRSMVGAICQIAQTIGLQTVAEFVSDAPTVALLKELDVTYGQGFYLGTPEPLEWHINAAYDPPGEARL